MSAVVQFGWKQRPRHLFIFAILYKSSLAAVRRERGIPVRKSIGSAVVTVTASLFISTAAHAVVGTWIGPTNSSWSNTAAWQGGVVPNGQGDTAQYVAGGSQVTVQDIAAGVTVGTIKLSGTANSSWQFTPNNDI